MLISGMITVLNPDSTSPRFEGMGFRYRRCAELIERPDFAKPNPPRKPAGKSKES